jgi:hypothetical protein
VEQVYKIRLKFTDPPDSSESNKENKQPACLKIVDIMDVDDGFIFKSCRYMQANVVVQ